MALSWSRMWLTYSRRWRYRQKNLINRTWGTCSGNLATDLVQVVLVTRQVGEILELQVQGTDLREDGAAARRPAPVLDLATSVCFFFSNRENVNKDADGAPTHKQKQTNKF